MSDRKHIPPSFWQRTAATWIDFVLLLGCYMVLGFVSEHLFQRDAYPRAEAMQLYTLRDFLVFRFFVLSTIALTVLYLGLCYAVFGATIGQCLARVRLLHWEGGKLTFGNIAKRIVTVLVRLFVIFIPGPIIAIIFILSNSSWLNPSLSIALLMAALLGLLYGSFVRYKRGNTLSFSDAFSGTILVDVTPGKRTADE